MNNKTEAGRPNGAGPDRAVGNIPSGGSGAIPTGASTAADLQKRDEEIAYLKNRVQVMEQRYQGLMLVFNATETLKAMDANVQASGRPS